MVVIFKFSTFRACLTHKFSRLEKQRQDLLYWQTEIFLAQPDLWMWQQAWRRMSPILYWGLHRFACVRVSLRLDHLYMIFLILQ